MMTRFNMKYGQVLRMVATCAAAGALVIAGCGRAPAPDENSVSGERVYEVAFASFGPDEAADNAIQGYLDGLRGEGFEEGKNLKVTRVHAFGEIGQLPLIMQSLEARGVDLIVPMSTPGLAAAFGSVKRTPMVFVYTYDPIAAGAGRSFDDHIPLATGVASFPPIEETMEIMLKLVPQAKKIGTIYNASEANSLRAVGVARDMLKAKGIELEEVTINSTAEVLQGTQALLGRTVDAVWVTGDNTVLQALEGVLRPATEAKIPVVLNDPEFVSRGALAAVGIAWHESGEAAGRMAARVLRGESPAAMPIVPLARRSVVVNQDVAAALGVTLPPELQQGSNAAP